MPFLDADHYFEKNRKIRVKEFVAKDGSPAFREAKAEVLKELLKDYQAGTFPLASRKS